MRLPIHFRVCANRTLVSRLTLAWLACALALTASCEQSEVATPRPVVVQVAGATSMHPVLQDLAAAFTKRHPSVLIDIRGGGSALGETRVRNGRSALAASTLLPEYSDTPASATAPLAAGVQPGAVATAPTRSATPADVTPVAPVAAALTRAPIGIDSIAVIVHGDNPVSSFTSLQLREIFGGRILDWKELGNDWGEIVLVSREDGSGTRSAFESRIMGDQPVSLTAVVMPTSKDVVEYVAKNPLRHRLCLARLCGRASRPIPGRRRRGRCRAARCANRRGGRRAAL